MNVVAWAEKRKQFEKKVKRMVETLDCVLIELEGVQLLENSMSNHDYPEELITMRDTATRQPLDTIFGAFHTWNQEDAN